MLIGEVCSRDAVVADASASLRNVVRLMREQHVGCVVVTRSPIDQPVPAGIVTDRDVVSALLVHGHGTLDLPASAVMTRDPLVLSAGLSIEDGIARLRARGVRRAPVVDVSGSLVGLVSVDDILSVLAEDLGSLAKLMALQPAREADAARLR